jgi:hypothetical protein
MIKLFYTPYDLKECDSVALSTSSNSNACPSQSIGKSGPTNAHCCSAVGLVILHWIPVVQIVPVFLLCGLVL